MMEKHPDGLTWETCLDRSLSLVDTLLAGSTRDPILLNQLAGLLEQLHHLRGENTREEPARVAQLKVLLRCVHEVEQQAGIELEGMRKQLDDDGRRRRLLKSLKTISRQ